jgi:cytochrome c556
LGILTLASSGLAFAGMVDVIEMRQAGQDLLEGNYEGIRMVVEARGEVEPLEAPAKAMGRWIRQFPAQFPPDTMQGHGTKALPAVWSDPGGFQKAAAAMADASDRLAAFAKAGDAKGVAAQVRVVGAACRDCHRDYRER